GISWMNYHAVAGDVSKLRRLARHRRRMARRRLVSLLEGVRHAVEVAKDIQFPADLFPLGIGRHGLHGEPNDDLFDAAENGRRAAFSIVDPSFEHFSEENPQDIGMGESFAAEVINRVMHGKGWPGTLLIWTYDEHGGYYDHVPPPAAVAPDDVEGRSMAVRPSWLRLAPKPLLPPYP